MGGINLQFDLSGKARRQKEENAQNLFLQLIDRGASPDLAQQVSAGFLKTGKIEIPKYETQTLPGIPDVPERSTRVPTRFNKDKKTRPETRFTFDESTGRYSDASGQPVTSFPENTDISIDRMDSSPKKGENIFIRGGQVIKREPNGTRKDQVIKLDPPSQGGGGAESPDLALAKDTVKKGQEMIQNGEAMTPEFKRSFETAAEMLGIPLENRVLDPTGFDRVRNKASKIAPKLVNPAPVRRSETPSLNFDKSQAAEFQNDLAQARKAIASGVVSEAEAITRLKKKYGKKINKL